MKCAGDLFTRGIRRLVGEVATPISNRRGCEWWGELLSCAKALYLKLRPTVLALAMIFVALQSRILGYQG